ncbi:MAG TPA: hypothetical protein VF519_05670 [Mycobacteriales bacterium]|jgi:hypothetical protein
MRVLRLAVAGAAVAAALAPAAPASACHEVVPAFDVGPVHFAGIYIPC